ncbi:MAG: hypothetical protein AAFN59_05110 [Pseudomonadota bacterium]
MATLLPLVFVVVNGIVWWHSTPLGFQRFGSIGVLIAATVFGLDRLSQIRRSRPLKNRDELMLTEITLVSVSTLQWGYGDLFHQWSHGLIWARADV